MALLITSSLLLHTTVEKMTREIISCHDKSGASMPPHGMTNKQRETHASPMSMSSRSLFVEREGLSSMTGGRTARTHMWSCLAEGKGGNALGAHACTWYAADASFGSKLMRFAYLPTSRSHGVRACHETPLRSSQSRQRRRQSHLTTTRRCGQKALSRSMYKTTCGMRLEMLRVSENERISPALLCNNLCTKLVIVL